MGPLKVLEYILNFIIKKLHVKQFFEHVYFNRKRSTNIPGHKKIIKGWQDEHHHVMMLLLVTMITEANGNDIENDFHDNSYCADNVM